MPSQSYNIHNHANRSENIFREDENYSFFLRQYAKYLGDVVNTYAYCLMPNHFHLLVGVKPEELLRKTFPKFETLEKLVSKRFSNFFSSYAQALNKKYRRKGSLFVKNFKRKPIQELIQWQETFLYIHLNPVKHGFVKNHQDWKWSSWHSYQFLDKPSNLDSSYYLNFFDSPKHINEMMEINRELLLNREYE